MSEPLFKVLCRGARVIYDAQRQGLVLEVHPPWVKIHWDDGLPRQSWVTLNHIGLGRVAGL